MGQTKNLLRIQFFESRGCSAVVRAVGFTRRARLFERESEWGQGNPLAVWRLVRGAASALKRRDTGSQTFHEPSSDLRVRFGMTYKEFYAQALLSSLPIAYSVEKDLLEGREPTPENVALGASQLAMALTELLASTINNVPRGDSQY